MMRGARTARRGLRAMIASASAKCSRARSATMRAGLRRAAGCASTVCGSSLSMPACAQRLARQIEPADAGVLVDVAQDVGELQRAAEMMRERRCRRRRPCRRRAPTAVRPRSPRGRNRDRACASVGRADVGDDIHLHAVDDGEEILALRGRNRAIARARPAELGGAAGVERVDVVAPLRRAAAMRASRAAVAVGDVVDRAAERIDLEHRLALRARQDAHGRDRTSCRRALRAPARSRYRACDVTASAPHRAACCAADAGSRPRTTGTAPSGRRLRRRLAEMHAFAQRIARVSRIATRRSRQRLDHGDFQRQPGIVDAARQSARLRSSSAAVRAARSRRQSSQRRRLAALAERLDAGAVRGQRIERNIDAVEVAIVVRRNPAGG